jgi:hypothetical protein
MTLAFPGRAQDRHHSITRALVANKAASCPLGRRRKRQTVFRPAKFSLTFSIPERFAKKLGGLRAVWDERGILLAKSEVNQAFLIAKYRANTSLRLTVSRARWEHRRRFRQRACAKKSSAHACSSRNFESVARRTGLRLIHRFTGGRRTPCP